MYESMSHPNLIRLKKHVEQAVGQFLNQWPEGVGDGLYDPIHYLMQLRGKQLRAVMALSAAEAEGQHFSEAMPVALGVELFHNFTLMHDDIMDAAPIRRGKETVHVKWNENAAILSGDAMYTLSHIALSELNPSYVPAALKLFNRTALEVCLGQQSDMAFESRQNVRVDEYLEMIRLKTSVLVAASLALGAIAAGSSEERVKIWYELGEQLGLAFQMQDDLLDTFGGDAVGKQIGGDILSDKKTFLRIHAWENGDDAVRQTLRNWDGNRTDPVSKIEAVRSSMIQAGSDTAAKAVMTTQIDRAKACIDQLQLTEDHAEWFRYLASLVTQRDS